MTKWHHARQLRYISEAIGILEAGGKTEFSVTDVIQGLDKVMRERLEFYENDSHHRHSYNGRHLPRDRPALAGLLTAYRKKLGIEAAGFREKARTWRRKK